MIEKIERYPVPLNEAEVKKLEGDMPPEVEFEAYHLDEFHEQYVTEIARTDDWSVFSFGVYGHEGMVYFWNHQVGEGIAISTNEWQCGSFVEAVSLFQQAMVGSDQDLPLRTSGGCPYCGGELSSDLRVTDTIRQKCQECGQSRIIG